MCKVLERALFVLLLTAAVTAKIQLVGNGYKSVVVSISADVAVNPDLLTNLESILTDGSATLFRATKNQVYFDEFIFVLPEKWPEKEGQYENASEFHLSEPDILIDKPNQVWGFTPYARLFSECGKQGKYMHLTPTYILDETQRGRYGRPGKVITHEWAHLRFGVFDEYPTTNEEKFYRHGDKWYPTKCSAEVDGRTINLKTREVCEIDETTGKPDDNCQFIPFKDNPAMASLMYGNYLENIEEFCDNAKTAPDHLKHNQLANNRHNRRCSSRSVWEVMRGHSDFKSLSNQTALPSTTNTQPRFRYVRASPKKRVLVLDTSGSMAGDPLIGLRQAASGMIFSTVETKSYLGIVRFSSSASVLSPLVQINSDSDRENLVDALPSSAAGATSIGAGLLLGLQLLLNETGMSGGKIILITDGQENTSPMIDDVIDDILRAGVVVDSLSRGQKADVKIAELSRRTHGTASFYSGSSKSTALLDFLVNTVTKGNDLLANEDISISILTEANKVTAGKPWIANFYIDSTIGNDTTLTFSFTEFIDVEIQGPNGPYNATSVRELSSPYSAAKVLRVRLENNLTPGLWSFIVMTNTSSTPVQVHVQSKPRRKGQEVIQVDSWLSQKENITFTPTSILGIYASVMRGRTPIADAIVIATVETPTSSTFNMNLMDNGLGIDLIQNDGVYSGNVIATDLNDNGRYNVKINVMGRKGSTKVFVSHTGSGNHLFGIPPTFGFPELNAKTEPLEDFRRVTTPGEFRVNGYTPMMEDLTPPGRIVDFEAKQYDATKHTVTLEWTAVGGDFDLRQAARYIIYKSLDVNDIIGNLTSASRIPEHHVLSGNLFFPLPAGQREIFVVFLQELELNGAETVYMSVSAVDEAGNEGQTSNLAIVSDAREIFVTEDVDEDENSDSNTTRTVLIIAGPVALVVMATTVIVIVLK